MNKAKQIYEANPSAWIVLWAIPIGWMNHGKWVKSIDPKFNEENHYKLISIKHKDILDAYLADNSVGIETSFYSEWQSVSDFIENYEPDLEYRLEERQMSDETKANIWFYVSLTAIYFYGVYWYIEGVVK